LGYVLELSSIHASTSYFRILSAPICFQATKIYILSSKQGIAFDTHTERITDDYFVHSFDEGLG